MNFERTLGAARFSRGYGESRDDDSDDGTMQEFSQAHATRNCMALHLDECVACEYIIDLLFQISPYHIIYRLVVCQLRCQRVILHAIKKTPFFFILYHRVDCNKKHIARVHRASPCLRLSVVFIHLCDDNRSDRTPAQQTPFATVTISLHNSTVRNATLADRNVSP